MAIFNVFKKKKIEKKKEKPEVEEKPVETIEKTKELKEERIPGTKALKAKPRKTGESWQALIAPHVTEKATDLTEKNQYIFRVWPKANKPEIKKAIENLYGVDVVAVKIVKIPRRKRRLGKISGWRKGYKKAIIKIKEGQKIEVLPR